MIEYLYDIQPLEGDLSDAEIASHLSARTATPIDAPAARDALLESGSVVVDPATGNRIGPLIEHYSSLTDGQDKVLLAWFLNYVFGEGTAIETNSYPRSVQFAVVEGGLPAEIASVAAANKPVRSAASSCVNGVCGVVKSVQENKPVRATVWSYSQRVRRGIFFRWRKR